MKMKEVIPLNPRRRARHDPIYRLIGDRLIAYRKSNEYTQAQFADMIGMSQSAYSRLENGDSVIRVDQLLRIARACKTRVRTLIGNALD
jgi:transcriptional regulator with XRE-family HTH domain